MIIHFTVVIRLINLKRETKLATNKIMAITSEKARGKCRLRIGYLNPTCAGLPASSAEDQPRRYTVLVPKKQGTKEKRIFKEEEI